MLIVLLKFSFLSFLAGVKSIDVDLGQQRLVIEGDILAESVRDVIEKRTGMAAVLLGHGSSSEFHEYLTCSQ